MPSQTFNTLDEWQTWIDANIITNGNQEITGNDGNITESAAVKFIKRSPLNWEKAIVVSSGGDVVASRPVSIFMTTTPTSLTWGDNIYNEFVFVNMTGSAIPLLGSLVYYNAFGDPVDNIPANQVVNIVKASNDLWVTGNSILPTPLDNLVPEDIEFYADANSFMPVGSTTKTINEYKGYNLLFFRGLVVQSKINRNDGASYYTWDRDTAILTWFPEIQPDENIKLMPCTGRGFVLQPNSLIYPLKITNSNIEPDGITINNASIVGSDVAIFVNEFNQQWLYAPTYFTYTATGIQLNPVFFDANTNSYTIQIQKITL